MVEAAIVDAPRVEMVPFHGTDILAIERAGEIRVPMRTFCHAIGLPWEPQRKRISRDDILAEGASIMEVPSAGGVQRQVTLPLDLIPGFLFGAEANRFAPELQERVKLFQRECFRVLHGHFFDRPRAAPFSLEAATSAAHEGFRLIAALKRESDPAIRRTLHGMLDRICAAQGVPTPPAAAIGADALPARDLADAFFAGLERLSVLGIVWNHASCEGTIAVNLPEVLAHFREVGMPVLAQDQLERALRLHGTAIDGAIAITSGLTRKPVLCWIFREQLDA
jgi:hypothetical protein